MPEFQIVFCFTILVATATFFNVASAHVKIKPALPQIGDPSTVNDVESYTVKVVSTFVADLEKECPKTEKFKLFFEKLNAYSKYLCPVSKAKGYESDMKAKAGSLFQAMSFLGSVKNSSRGGSVNKSLQREKAEAMNTVNMLQSIGGKVAGGKDNKTDINGTMKLTVEQQKEIKDGILKWLQVITRVAKANEKNISKSSSKTQTMQQSKEEKSSTQTQTKRSSKRDSEKAQITALPRGSRVTKAGNSDDISKSARNSAKEIDNNGSKRGESKKNTDVKGGSQGSRNSSKNGNGSSARSTTTDAKGKGSKKVKSSRSKTESSEKASSVKEIEAETSNEVMTFITNLEKKSPATQEFKAFFDVLKASMKEICPESSMVSSKTLKDFKSATQKVSDAMGIVESKISKSGKVKSSMESYKQEVIKTLSELQELSSKIKKENENKKDGSLTVTTTQEKEIKQRITKWEQVTTQFVETAIQSETQSSSSTQVSSQNRKIKGEATIRQ